MRRACLRLIVVIGLFSCLGGSSRWAHAQVPLGAAADEAEPDARRFFERSLELYRAGRYAEALEQLQRAAQLDPGGKDLFYNLSLVHEKLGQLPEAITSLEHFRDLETDPKERERARLILERLRGALQAREASRPVPPPCPPVPPAAPQVQRPKAPLNPVLVGSASFAAASLVVGTVFGLKALADDVGDERTSGSLSVEQLRARGRRAEREALIADVAFALGLASATTFVSLWVTAPPEPTASRGGGVILRGYF